MTVTAKTLVEGTIVPGTDTTVYTAPANTTTIIDKVTAEEINKLFFDRQ